VVIHSNFI